MSDKHRVAIDARNPANVTITVDGHDISKAVRGYVLSHERPGVEPVLLLDILAPSHRTTFAGQTAVVELPDATREALVALGWTPPADGD